VGVIAYGYICGVDPSTGKVQVELDEDYDVEKGTKFVTNWLPVSFPFTHADKSTFPFDITSHVWVMFSDEEWEDGIVGGCIYDANNTPDSDAGPDIHKITYKDGSYIKFDRSSGKYTVNVTGDINFRQQARLMLLAVAMPQ